MEFEGNGYDILATYLMRSQPWNTFTHKHFMTDSLTPFHGAIAVAVQHDLIYPTLVE
jgi:hypothetical protein